MATKKQFEAFFVQYIETLLWSECDDDGTPLDENYDASDLSDLARESMRKDCLDFVESNEHLFNGEYEQAGHDFALTRNRHGTGFWDRDPSMYADQTALTDAADDYGCSHLMPCDDGKLYETG